jgi:hypothetical protein
VTCNFRFVPGGFCSVCLCRFYLGIFYLHKQSHLYIKPILFPSLQSGYLLFSFLITSQDFQYEAKWKCWKESLNVLGHSCKTSSISLLSLLAVDFFLMSYKMKKILSIHTLPRITFNHKWVFEFVKYFFSSN